MQLGASVTCTGRGGVARLIVAPRPPRKASVLQASVSSRLGTAGRRLTAAASEDDVPLLDADGPADREARAAAELLQQQQEQKQQQDAAEEERKKLDGAEQEAKKQDGAIAKFWATLPPTTRKSAVIAGGVIAMLLVLGIMAALVAAVGMILSAGGSGTQEIVKLIKPFEPVFAPLATIGGITVAAVTTVVSFYYKLTNYQQELKELSTKIEAQTETTRKEARSDRSFLLQTTREEARSDRSFLLAVLSGDATARANVYKEGNEDAWGVKPRQKKKGRNRKAGKKKVGG